MKNRSLMFRSVASALSISIFSTLNISRCDNEEKNATPAPVHLRNASAFLTKEGREVLTANFKPVHKETFVKPKMIISHDPQGAVLAQIGTQLGRPVDLQVLAVVIDENIQTTVVEIVKVAEDDDGGVPVKLDDTHPHINVSATNPDVYSSNYSNELIKRVIEAAGGLDKDWKGRLPGSSEENKETECEVIIPKEKVVLSATLCVSDHWDEENDRCGEPGCGFCKFMKLGPCGSVFAEWEKCIDSCKDSKDDFVDVCAAQTGALKICVDEHPDYYYSVLGEDEGDKQKEEKSEESNAAPPPTTTTTSQMLEVDQNPVKIDIDPHAKVEMSAPAETTQIEEDQIENWVTKG